MAFRRGASLICFVAVGEINCAPPALVVAELHYNVLLNKNIIVLCISVTYFHGRISERSFPETCSVVRSDHDGLASCIPVRLLLLIYLVEMRLNVKRCREIL